MEIKNGIHSFGFRREKTTMKPFTGIPVDYSGKKYWLARPDHPDKGADLLFLYPSSCRDKNAGVICDIDNKSMIRGARRNFSQQATAFEPVANLFAPFWRQVNATKLSEMSFEEVDRAEWAEPRTDVYAALDYYFENLNHGRPYFLPGIHRDHVCAIWSCRSI